MCRTRPALRWVAMPDRTWIPVVPATDVAGPPWVCHDVAGVEVRLVRDPQGRIHAVAPACPHLASPLDRAEIDDGHLRCPRHWYAYALANGANTHPGLDRNDDLAVHDVEVRDGIVHVAVGRIP